MLQINTNKHFGQPNTMVNTCHYTFTKLIECKIPRVNPNVSYGLCVIMVQQSRSIAYKRCTILEWDVDVSSGCACVETRGIQEISVPSLYFVMGLKISFVKKKKLCLTFIIYILKKWYVGKWVLTITFYNPDSSVGKEYACNSGDLSSIPGWGRSAEEGIGYPLQYSWASLWLSW